MSLYFIVVLQCRPCKNFDFLSCHGARKKSFFQFHVTTSNLLVHGPVDRSISHFNPFPTILVTQGKQCLENCRKISFMWGRDFCRIMKSMGLYLVFFLNRQKSLTRTKLILWQFSKHYLPYVTNIVGKGVKMGYNGILFYKW